ncbi:MAG: rod shape-determining protein RodA [Blastocatellia bacterium]|nr:rod shape-determining protein RodA [Blastocatellia bacterium]
MITYRQKRRFLLDFDWWLLGGALILALLGVLEIYSSQPQEDFWKRQLLWLGIALVAMFVTATVDYHRIVEVAPFIYGSCLFLLVLVLPFGQEVYGTRAWLGIGPFSIQPSEFAKIGTILMLALFLAERWEEHRREKHPYLTMREILIASGIAGAPVLLILLEPDVGTALTFVPILGGMLFVAGLRPRIITAGVVGVAVALSLGWYFRHQVLKPYQVQRIEVIFHPERADRRGYGYQTYQSMIAVGSGGLTGRGLFRGTQSRLRFLPKAYTDFIAAVVAEELGFLGILGVLALYAFLLLRALNHAKLARDSMGTLLVTGIVSLLSFHILMNLGMIVGLVPVIGIPLPLMSYGGSALVATFIGLGLIANVRLHRYVN